jgi:iron complex transport system ATP-binding protein
MNTIMSAKGLDVGYENKTVISDINIEAIKGQIICLLGPNGAGKSTILRTLSGLLSPVKGFVEIDGANISRIKQKNIAKKLSLVLTDNVSPSLTTVNEIVAMGRIPYTGFMGKLTENDWNIVKESLEMVGAYYLRERYYSQLSDGEKQKVMIARALVQEPELMILDEPTSHLDIKHKIEIIRVLQRLANEKQITCILSLHDIDIALKGCQTVLLVNNGVIVAQGAPEDIVKNGCIQKLYGISGAKYNELLGSVEFVGNSIADIFVTGGNSTGINIYRALSRNGYGINAGVLHENDTDFQVAKIICSEVVTEIPFEPISNEKVQKAMQFIKYSKCVIDTGFPIGSGNKGNVKILNYALTINKPVLSIRDKSECHKIYGENSEKVIYCDGIFSLLKCIRKILENNDLFSKAV